MKVQIVYDSLTGCTEKVAKAIFEAVPAEEKSLHRLGDGIPALDGDVILCGYWCTGIGPDEPMQAFLKSLSGKAVGIFCTLGYYAGTAYADSTAQAGVALVQDRNRVIGTYVCNGAVARQLQEGQGSRPDAAPTQQKELRWAMLADHPTPEECALAAQRFAERITLYRRCRELGISFSSIV